MNSKKFHPVASIEEGLFNTLSGTIVDINHIDSSMIHIDDISNALSKINRFGGHTSAFYSVAQHSVLVAHMAPDHLKKAALLHDAAEAYLGDVIAPLKYILGNAYKSIEREFEMAIAAKFNLDLQQVKLAIKQYDTEALHLEFECFQRQNYSPLLVKMQDLEMSTNPYAWNWVGARFEFNKMYARLFDIEIERLPW